MEDVVVIGAGAAGLAAAHHLRSHGIDPLVLEASDRAGGVVRTDRDAGWLLEAGPHAVHRDPPAVRTFLADTAMPPERLVDVSPQARDRYVLVDGRPRPVPRGPGGLFATPLLSAAAKMRLLAEPWVRRGHHTSSPDHDESVHTFLTRRFGPGIGPVVDAVVTGIHAGDPARLSAAATLPRLVAWERDHGSILRGAWRARRARTPRGPLMTARTGMETLVTHAATDLRSALQTRVVGLDTTPDGRLRVRVHTHEGHARTIETRRVVVAVPSGVAAAWFPEVPDPAVPTAPVAVVGLGYRTADLPANACQGYGVLHPEREGRRTLGVLHESSLFPHRAPEGHTLVRALVGGRRHPGRAAWSDERLVAAVSEDLARTQAVHATPVWHRIVRQWPGIPQLEQGHAARLQPVRDALDALGPVKVGAWGWDGVGLVHAFEAGQTAARAVLDAS